MGFRTLAIQKRSSEVWNLLAAVKTEWANYGKALDIVQKKLHEASNKIDDAQKRSRAVGRKLKDVQEIPVGEATALLPQNVLEDDAETSDSALVDPEAAPV
jgi:DNA recombination protein RmuC